MGPGACRVPLGTELGPVLFMVMVTDLVCRSSYSESKSMTLLYFRGSSPWFPSIIQDDLDSKIV